MIQVKEFLNYQEGQENQINEWLQEMEDSIEVIDIKYSVSAFQTDEKNGWDCKEFSGALIIFKIIGNKEAIENTGK